MSRFEQLLSSETLNDFMESYENFNQLSPIMAIEELFKALQKKAKEIEEKEPALIRFEEKTILYAVFDDGSMLQMPEGTEIVEKNAELGKLFKATLNVGEQRYGDWFMKGSSIVTMKRFLSHIQDREYECKRKVRENSCLRR